jgi:iron complex transport system ATP-binding protein
MIVLALEEVSVAYSGRPALDRVTLAVPAGEWLGLIGPNGAGKTTLLRVAAGLIRHGGRVRVGGEAPAALGRRSLAQQVALVEQDPPLPLEITVAELVMLGRTPYIPHLGWESRSDRLAVGEVLARLDLVPFAGRRLGTLSGGERQRAVVARALAQEPRLLLLDEPTTALDVGRQQQVLELVAELRAERGLTVVSATHDLTLAATYADRLALLGGGRLAALGPPREVLTEEALAHHYGATLRVLSDEEGGLAVIPVRPRRAAPAASGIPT